MGAVHGVYLKYVGLSAVSLAGCGSILHFYPHGDTIGGSNDDKIKATPSSNARGGSDDSRFLGLSTAFSALGGEGVLENVPLGALNVSLSSMPSLTQMTCWILAYSGFINGGIAVGFLLQRGVHWIGKNTKTGQIPLWSYVIYFPFYIPTITYTYLHTKIGRHMITHKDGSRSLSTIPVASEVLPGWWLGGRYSHWLERSWDGIIDLTVEFPELASCNNYLCIPLWDGVPPTPAQLEEAACFAADCYFGDDNQDKPHGDVLIHCAHGRGRSTTVMCAALVKTQLFPTWEAAFNAIKAGRPVVKLNGKMRRALTEWQATYVEHLDKKQI